MQQSIMGNILCLMHLHAPSSRGRFGSDVQENRMRTWRLAELRPPKASSCHWRQLWTIQSDCGALLLLWWGGRGGHAEPNLFSPLKERRLHVKVQNVESEVGGKVKDQSFEDTPIILDYLITTDFCVHLLTPYNAFIIFSSWILFLFSVQIKQ